MNSFAIYFLLLDYLIEHLVYEITQFLNAQDDVFKMAGFVQPDAPKTHRYVACNNIKHFNF